MNKYTVVMATRIEKKYVIEADSWDEAIERAERTANKPSHRTLLKVQGYDTPWEWEVEKSIPGPD